MTGVARTGEAALSTRLNSVAELLPSKVDEVADRLFTAIAIGEYLPGERLPDERAMATSLGVARATLREALARLVKQQVLETRRGRGGGSFVRSADGPDSAAAVRRSLDRRWAEMVDAIEAVSRLQEAIVRAAAENRTPADIANLRSLLADFLTAATGRPKQRADERLHLGICEAAHNATLTDLLIGLERRISIVGPGHLWGAQEDHALMEERASADHAELVRLIAAGEVEQGGLLARRHAHIDLELLESARRRALAQSQPQANETP